MALSQEQRDQVEAAITKRFVDEGRCSLCGSKHWVIGDGIGVFELLPSLAAGSRSHSGMPVLPIVCSQCGNTHLLNLMTLGLMEAFGQTTLEAQHAPTG